ncbi:hypothetical protein HDV01_004279, partial [Terramyces sp. JEL0728]
AKAAEKSTTSLDSKSNESLGETKKKTGISFNDIAHALRVYTSGIDDSILDISYHRVALEQDKKE